MPTGLTLLNDNVRPPVMDPFVFVAALDPNGLTLSGSVPSENMRKQLKEWSRQPVRASDARRPAAARLRGAQGLGQRGRSVAAGFEPARLRQDFALGPCAHHRRRSPGQGHRDRSVLSSSSAICRHCSRPPRASAGKRRSSRATWASCSPRASRRSIGTESGLTTGAMPLEDSDPRSAAVRDSKLQMSLVVRGEKRPDGLDRLRARSAAARVPGPAPSACADWDGARPSPRGSRRSANLNSPRGSRAPGNWPKRDELRPKIGNGLAQIDAADGAREPPVVALRRPPIRSLNTARAISSHCHDSMAGKARSFISRSRSAASSQLRGTLVRPT